MQSIYSLVVGSVPPVPVCATAVLVPRWTTVFNVQTDSSRASMMMDQGEENNGMQISVYTLKD